MRTAIIIVAVFSTAILGMLAYSKLKPGAPTALQVSPSGENILSETIKTVPRASIDKRDVDETDYSGQFSRSKNYWDFARQILPAANSGDRDAQYYLARALTFCAESNKMYFERHGRSISLDEGIQWAAQRHLSNDVALKVYAECHDFQEKGAFEYGSSADWLAKATENGQPLAEATTASQLLLESIRNIRANSGESVAKPDEAIRPRQLLLKAIQSRDPTVLFTMGEAQAMLDPANPDKNLDRYAWYLVACLRGFDCSSNADWVKTACAGDPSCAGATAPDDLIREFAGDDFPDVQRRANEISVKLDAGEWAALVRPRG